MCPKRRYSLQKKLYKSFVLFSKGKDAFVFFFFSFKNVEIWLEYGPSITH